MGNGRNFGFLLILASFLCGIQAQSEVVTVISHDKHNYDVQGCNCHCQFDQAKFEKMEDKLDKLERKIDKIDESINKLIHLIEMTPNSNPHAGKNDNAPAIVGANNKNLDFDEHLNYIQNCNTAPGTPKTCQEALSNMTNEDGVYILHSNGLQPFGAYCMRYDNSGWTVIQRRPDGFENFYRSWSDYKYGFGNLSGGYWLGLERLHTLTSTQSYELYVLMRSRENVEMYARYSVFYVQSEKDGYRLTVSGHSGNAQDSLSYYNGKTFSTFVEQNDRVSHDSNCVEQTKSAWWYGGHECSYDRRYVSLNGEYRPYTSNGEGIYWWSSSYHSLKYVHMAIRPI